MKKLLDWIVSVKGVKVILTAISIIIALILATASGATAGAIAFFYGVSIWVGDIVKIILDLVKGE